MTRVRLLRSWNTSAGQHHPPEVLEVAPDLAWRMAQTVPPYAVPVVAVDATPAALALARASGLDLSGRTGSGKGGRITKADVARWARG